MMTSQIGTRPILTSQFHMPVKVYAGENSVAEHENEWKIGKKCLIVTGRSSAVRSGALADVAEVLTRLSVTWKVFDRIGENPLLSVCMEGGREAKDFGADFIVGIGGGSPMDASKAIAAFAASDLTDPMQLFESEKLSPSLPILLIPLTAGTGSEVNPYAVMTLDGFGKKKTFKSPYSYAKAAFLDPRYTRTLSPFYTVSTALDAFCHCLESMLSPKSDWFSETMAIRGAGTLWRILTSHSFTAASADAEDAAGLTLTEREELLLAASAGGMAINKTGTGFPHPMGYSLTLHEKGIPHGMACAAFAGAFIEKNLQTEEGERRLRRFAYALGTTPEMMAKTIPSILPVRLSLSDETIVRYLKLVETAGNFTNSQYILEPEERFAVMKSLMGEKT